jgi:hypothetical protein
MASSSAAWCLVQRLVRAQSEQVEQVRLNRS